MANIFSSAFVILSCVLIQAAYGMDCSLGTSENAIEKFINTCPRPIIDSSSESYCCYSYDSDGRAHSVTCCGLWDFIISTVSHIILPIIIIALVVSFLISCICCLCCRKSRSGRVLQPVVVVTVPSLIPMPAGVSTSSQPLLIAGTY